jgi:hypothetical protein
MKERIKNLTKNKLDDILKQYVLRQSKTSVYICECAMKSYIIDESRPLKVGLQEQTLNQLMLL